MAPPTKPQLITIVSQITAIATVAIEKKMPRRRSVNAAHQEAHRAGDGAAATTCTRNGAANAWMSATEV